MKELKKSVFLCGFMGCGKSTTGKILAEKLDCEFVDMDEYIVKEQGMSITAIFAEKGESFFRSAETDAVKALAAKKCVIACGGGAMLKKENAEIAAKAGEIVYIDVPFEECYDRVKGEKSRPIVTGSTKEDLSLIYESRAPVYSANSTVKINGSGTPVQVAEKIAAVI